MAERIGAAQAKTHFSALLAQVAYGGKQFIIERRGKPLAALVGLDMLDGQERAEEPSELGHWALALIGAWGELEEGEIDSLTGEIYADRERDLGRSVVIED